MAGSMRSGAGQACLDKETRAVGEVCETPAQTGVFSDGNRMAPVCGYVVFFCFVCRRYCDNGRIGQTGVD